MLSNPEFKKLMLYKHNLYMDLSSQVAHLKWFNPNSHIATPQSSRKGLITQKRCYFTINCKHGRLLMTSVIIGAS